MSESNISVNSQRRLLLLGAISLGAHSFAAVAAPRIPIQVWKDPTCGCCQDWISHLEQHGFSASVMEQGNGAARSRLGMPKKYGSCHTALVEGYVIEGHVPAADIQHLLKKKPAALGLAVPGMPIGSPGMDGPAYGGQHEAYQVLLVQKNGSSTVFKSYS